jgi:hypothetical protein
MCNHVSDLLLLVHCFAYTYHTYYSVYPYHPNLLTHLPYHMPSILRKRKSQHKVSEPAPLRPSLSLPDITSPLLDTSTWGWDEVPPLVTSHTVRTTPSPSERNRKPSLVRDPNSPVQFHRPFTPWQVVDPTPNRHGAALYQGNGANGNFRDTAKWRASAAGSQVSSGKKRGRGRGKVPESLNIVVETRQVFHIT